MVLIVNGPDRPRASASTPATTSSARATRANATIGRAVRLTMMNVMNTRPGFLDRATLGNPGKYSFCFAENEVDHPWEPLHVERGCRPEQSAVTVYASNSLCQVYNQLAADARAAAPLLRRRPLQSRHAQPARLQPVARRLRGRARRRPAPERLEQGATCGAFSWSTPGARVADLKRAGRRPGEVEPADETTWKHAFERPEDILIVCAGGQAGSWSACLPGWGNKWTRSVTTVIDTP